MSDGPFDPDSISRVIHSLYSTLSFKPPPRQFTILAAFVLYAPGAGCVKVISLGTGSKCLPETRLCKNGDVVHDCHAEVLARRGAVRWFMQEVGRLCDRRAGKGPQETADQLGNDSPWLKQVANGKFALNDGVRVMLYVSTPPCGDASTRYLASSQDPGMAALKDSSTFPALPPGTASRGRDNYRLFGVLRTKPGRADSPPTLCMSCSDKIASWSVLGIQGALTSRFLQPIYVTDVVLGEVAPEMQKTVQEDCDRAFGGRLTGQLGSLPAAYVLRGPTVCFTSLPFVHSRSSLVTQEMITACNDSLCWIADSPRPSEVLINGIKRGVSPKNHHNPKFRPLLSKLSLFNQYLQLPRLSDAYEDMKRDAFSIPEGEATSHNVPQKVSATYYDTKQMMVDYQACKFMLQGPEGPFSGWVKSGVQWQSFRQDGTVCE